MTIVVTDSKVIAADTQIDDDGNKSTGPKLFTSAKAIIGVAGDYKHAVRFVNWFNDRRKKKPKKSDSFEALVFTKKSGLEYWDQTLEPQKIYDTNYAIGSGANVALGAMYMGATPGKAAEAACHIDTYCGGSIDTEGLTFD